MAELDVGRDARAVAGSAGCRLVDDLRAVTRLCELPAVQEFGWPRAAK